MGYTGLVWGIGNLGGDIYTNNAIGAAVEIASFAFCFLVLVAGRKIVYIILMVVGGVGLITAAVLQSFYPGTCNIVMFLIRIALLSHHLISRMVHAVSMEKVTICLGF